MSSLVYLFLGLWLKSMALSYILGLLVTIFCKFHAKFSNTRLHWIEIHEKEWCPNLIRQFIRRMIFYYWKYTASKSITAAVTPFVEKYDISLILDLCSGCCGPSDMINKNINKNITNDDNNKIVTTILTDLYPDISSWNIVTSQNKNVLYSAQSIDTANIDMNKINNIMNTNNKFVLKTMFASFHHFKPISCIKIFQDAFKNNDMIMICDWNQHIIWQRMSSIYGFMQDAVFQFVMSLFRSFNIFRFWLFEEKDTILLTKMMKCLLCILFYSLFLFVWTHDRMISFGRMYDEYSLKKMAENSLNKINNNNNTIKYKFKYLSIRGALYLFVCIPNSMIKSNTE